MVHSKQIANMLKTRTDEVLCASGACCPEDILKVPVVGGGVQILEVLGSVPSCCGPNPERGPGLVLSCLLEMGPGLERDQAEVSLPLGGQGWTSLRRNSECVAAKSSPLRREDNRSQGSDQNLRADKQANSHIYSKISYWVSDW